MLFAESVRKHKYVKAALLAGAGAGLSLPNARCGKPNVAQWTDASPADEASRGPIMEVARDHGNF